MKGSLAPLVTPFHQGRLDETRFLDLIAWHLESGTHGIVVAGTTGEPDALSIEEREHLIELTVQTVRKRIPVLAGTGTNNFAATLRLTTFAKRVGADAALVVVPYYVRPTQEGLYRYFRAIAEAVEIPIVLYNIPGRAAANLDPPTIARLARDCRNIVGVKEANKDFEHVNRVIHLCGSTFRVYSGIELLCFPMLAIGGAGHVSATANILPREVAQLYDLVAAGKWDAARELHYHLLPLNDALFIETNPVPVKAALGLMGKIDPEVRLPLVPMSPEHLSQLKAVLDQYGLLTPLGNLAGRKGAGR